jgi:chromosome segregation ATPase
MDMKPLLIKLLEKGYGWLSRLINITDHSITKVSIFLQEKKKRLEEYLIDREQLLEDIEESQSEIEYLQNKIYQTNTEQNEHLLELYNKLEIRTQDLLNNQQQLTHLHKSIVESKDVIDVLSNEKELAINERNYLRSEYDHLQTIIQENQKEQVKLEDKIKYLLDNRSQEHDVLAEKQIKEYEANIEKLQIEKNNYQQQYISFQEKLNEKMSFVAKLSGELLKAESEILEKQELVKSLEQRTVEFEEEIRNYKLETSKQKSLIEKNKKRTSVYNERISELKRITTDLNIRLEEANHLYVVDLDKAHHEISVLKEDLIKEQNNLAMERERNGIPPELNAETLKILEQEYEPRFSTLYKECLIHDEFYRDFFSLIPSDRLKVEACIVNLNYNYNQNMSKVRPNSVKTRMGTTINEYPFGQEGRIYFNKNQGKVNFYRISRTKNGKGKLDQNSIISWLKKNK